MTKTKGLDHINPKENERFHWSVQKVRKIATVVTAVFLVAALGRVFGPGPANGVLRAAFIYLFLLVVFRLYGRRTLGQITTFDFVLLLIISEAIQPAMVGEDPSLLNAAVLVLTLFGIDELLSVWKHRSHRANAVMDGMPLVLIENGRLVKKVMDSVQLDEEDILSSAREAHGLSQLDEIQFAVLEVNGSISIVPRQQRKPEAA
jgi:uncharacterized membrane protein YcaP (DUF421 family)